MKKIKKNKFNLLDAVIIVILFSLMVAAYLKTNHREITMMNVKESKVSITLCAEVSDDFKDYNKLSGTELYLADYNQKIGIIDSISQNEINDKTTLTEVGMNDDNNMFTIILSDVCVKKSDERGYYLNGSYFIAKGKSLNITTQDGIIFTAIIDDIREIK